MTREDEVPALVELGRDVKADLSDIDWAELATNSSLVALGVLIGVRIAGKQMTVIAGPQSDVVNDVAPKLTQTTYAAAALTVLLFSVGALLTYRQD